MPEFQRFEEPELTHGGASKSASQLAAVVAGLAAALPDDVDSAHDGHLRVNLPVSALNQVPQGIARVDSSGALTYCNRSMLRMAGLASWEGHHLRDLFQGEDLDAVLDGLRRRAALEGDDYQAQLTRPDGVRVPIAITAFPETDADGIVGTLALVRDLTLDTATSEMVKLVESISKTSDLLDAISTVLRRLVPFDLLQVLRLNKSRTHLRAIYPEVVSKERSYRWWFIPDGLRHLLESHEPLVLNNLEAWYQAQRAGGLPADPAIQQFIDDGFTGTMSLPVFQDGAQVASIVLCRKENRHFTEEEASLADKLPLTEAASVALRNETEGDLNFLIGLINDVAGAYDTVRNVAQTVVKRIADHYAWDYVSIHQVDNANHQIRLIAQQTRQPGLLSDRLVLGIDKGIVGEVHRTGQPVRVANIETDPVYKHIFVAHRKTITHSELCVPIGASAQWLINVEDEKTDAFCPEDESSLKKVATSLEALLRRTLDYNYRAAVVKNAKDAILLVDSDNIVVEANDAAAGLLRRPVDAMVARPIAELLDGSDHAELLLQDESFDNHCAWMRRSDGKTVRVLLSVARLPDDSPGRVFIASDLSQYERSDELEMARDLFREITGQVKTPMSLAISWLRRFSQQTGQIGNDLPDKVLHQLQKAELTLDRMLLIERNGEPSQRFPSLLELNEVVERSLQDLPERERQSIGLVSQAPNAMVHVDAFELRYCVLTVLTYLLRLAVHASRIELRTSVRGGEVHLEIGGRADAERAKDFDASCRSGQAVAELALGRQTLTDIATRNGGRYEQRRDGDHASFSFSFPRSHPREAP